jgi:hypothetical protein
VGSIYGIIRGCGDRRQVIQVAAADPSVPMWMRQRLPSKLHSKEGGERRASDEDLSDRQHPQAVA